VGKIIVKIKLTNLKDIHLLQVGFRKEQPRQAEVDALVDTGATRLCLKPSVISALGLEKFGTVSSKTSNGSVMRGQYDAVELELMGRRQVFDVLEVSEEVPNLLGQVPLEVLDFVADPRGRQLIPNPEHGGEQMTEEYRQQ
jgi:predicted aspartyl protease